MASTQLAVKGGSQSVAPVVVVEAVAKALEAGLKAFETYSQYMIVREHRYALEAKLDAEIRKNEIELEALHARLRASVEFLRLNQLDNAGKRASYAITFEKAYDLVKTYVSIHAKLLETAKTPEDMDRAEAVWRGMAPFVEMMNETTRLVSRQTLAWLE